MVIPTLDVVVSSTLDVVVVHTSTCLPVSKCLNLRIVECYYTMTCNYYDASSPHNAMHSSSYGF